MTARYVLAPQAATDLDGVWNYVAERSSAEMADRIQRSILEKILFLAARPQAGHTRTDLTDKPVKFFPIYAYLVVYRPETNPLQIVSIIHGYQDVKRVLASRPLM